MQGSWIFECNLGFDRSWNHIPEEDLEGHGMPTALMRKEELAITLELTIFKPDLVIVIIAVESEIELVEVKAVAFLGIALGFLSFSYHSGIHHSVSFQI